MYRYHNGPQRQCRFALSRHIKATNQVNSTICKSVTKCASITQSHSPIQQQYCAFTNATPNRSAENGTGSIINPHWKRKESGKFQRPIFVAATRQHVGKTTVSLALVSGLKKRFDKVGFIKPVGQQHVQVQSEDLDQSLRVDKDVCLVREHFHLDHIDYQHMSPVIIPRGYTKSYIEGKISHENQLNDIRHAFHEISSTSDIMLCEGTGHCAVGSVVNVNNAMVASMVGADMVLIANGGLGSAFDELELNRVLCQHHNVRLAGVIINKVIPDKMEQTRKYLAKAMMSTWGVPLLGCVPDKPFLGCPALADFERLFNAKMMGGCSHRMRHYRLSDINLVTTSLCHFLENLRSKPDRTLYVCHITRNDVLLGFLGEHQRAIKKGEKFEAAMLVCGRKGKYEMSPQVRDMVKGGDAPVLFVEYSTNSAMEMIHDFTPKLNIDDTSRVAHAVDHYEPYIDFDELLRRTSSSNSSFDDPTSGSFNDLKRI